jgi:type IV secretory pathway TrbF-like protein
MSASTYNISVERNVNFCVVLTLKDANGNAINVADAAIDAEIKQDYYFPNLTTFAITKVNPEFGVIKLELTAAQTAVLHPGNLKYDVLIKYADGTFQKILKGNVAVDPNISTLS